MFISYLRSDNVCLKDIPLDIIPVDIPSNKSNGDNEDNGLNKTESQCISLKRELDDDANDNIIQIEELLNYSMNKAVKQQYFFDFYLILSQIFSNLTFLNSQKIFINTVYKCIKHNESKLCPC